MYPSHSMRAELKHQSFCPSALSSATKHAHLITNQLNCQCTCQQSAAVNTAMVNKRYVVYLSDTRAFYRLCPRLFIIRRSFEELTPPRRSWLTCLLRTLKVIEHFTVFLTRNSATAAIRCLSDTRLQMQLESVLLSLDETLFCIKCVGMS